MDNSGISNSEWAKEQEWEKNWWATRTLDQIKNEENIHMPEMRELQPEKDVKTIDIGGGPVSVLRDWTEGNLTVLDPLDFGEMFEGIYKEKGIKRLRIPAEQLNPIEHGKFDQALIYNVLQHVKSPERVVQAAVTTANTVRLIEPTGIAPSSGHPHVLTTERVVNAFMEAAKQPWNNFKYEITVRSGPVEGLGGTSVVVIFKRVKQ